MKADADAALAASMAHCAQVTRTRARNFYYGLRLAPEPKRSALYALYAWMREADDVVDEPSLPGNQDASIRLDDFRQRTDAALDGLPDGESPVWIALAHAARQFPIRRDDLHAMLNGQAIDLNTKTFATWADLRRYCECVASSVGLACISIFGYRDARAPYHAIERGIALQLTNILRDFAEDYDRGRIYLPRSDFARHGLAPHELRNWTDSDRCAAFIRDQCAVARSFYDASQPLEGMIDADCRPVLWAMTAIYAELLGRINRDPTRTVTLARVRLGFWRKAMIVVQARRRTSTPAAETAR